MTSNRIHLSIAAAAALLLSAWTSVIGATQVPDKEASAAAQPASDVYRDIYNGWKWWHVYCYRCHGVDALGTPTAPNLSDPMEKLAPAAFLTIVRNGRPNTAMQGWNKLLDDKQIGQIHLYVRARSEKVLPPGRPDEIGPNGGQWVPPQGWPKR